MSPRAPLCPLPPEPPWGHVPPLSVGPRWGSRVLPSLPPLLPKGWGRLPPSPARICQQRGEGWEDVGAAPGEARGWCEHCSGGEELHNVG